MDNWRDIADQLDDDQRCQLERLENASGHGKTVTFLFAGQQTDVPDALLRIARNMAAENLCQTVLSDVPAPAGAVTVDRWEHYSHGWARHFTSGTVQAGPAAVTVHGLQHSDGDCRRWVSVRGADELDTDQARELAAALAAAADTL
jgi:hypothetical protein